MRFSISKLILVMLALFGSGLACAQKSLDFVAEHLIEVPMDFRYLSLTASPVDEHRVESRVQIGLANVSGEGIDNRTSMLSLQYFLPLQAQRGLGLSLFYDDYRFSSGKGRVVVAPSFTRQFSPSSVNAEVTGGQGRGYHAGVGISYIYLQQDKSNHQLGVLLESLKIHEFRINFNTVDLTSDYAAMFDYAASYAMITPYYSYQKKPDELAAGWIGRLSAVLALPLPRVGFEGRIQGPGFDYSGDTDAALGRKNIPDMYAGLGYSLEHKVSGIRLELGGLLYSALIEPLLHEDTGTPIYISASFAF